MDKVVAPSQLNFGDEVIINHTHYTVKDIYGPDRIGTYDLFLKDEQGKDHIAIVTETITLHL
jgi:hypothetical protein